MGGACVKCFSYDTRLYRGDDGHFRKECDECGHVGGPYTSRQLSDERSGQTSLDSF